MSGGTFADLLRRAPIPSSEARLLLAAAASVPQTTLIAHPERSVDALAQARFHDFVRRRARGEPVAYILGRREFFSLELEVAPDVLVPRPETELLVERALERPFAVAADLGTGSGAIAIVLQRARPQACLVAIDASARALRIARRNAARLAPGIQFVQGHWSRPLADRAFDLIVSNPPYVAEGDPHLAALAYEPREALVAGRDGLDAIREIAAHAPRCLKRGGWLLLEHGAGQDEAVRQLLGDAGLEEPATWPDLAGIPRVTGGRVK